MYGGDTNVAIVGGLVGAAVGAYNIPIKIKLHFYLVPTLARHCH